MDLITYAIMKQTFKGDGDDIERITWHQDSEAVQNYIDLVDYSSDTTYETSSISTYAPTPAVPATHTKPIGQTVDNITYYHNIPNKETPFASENKAGTLTPLDQVRWINSKTSNMRDLGGWPCDGGTVKYGLLYRSGDISAQDEDLFINELGINTECDLTADGVPAFPGKMRFIGHTAYAMYNLTPRESWITNLTGIFEAVKYGDPVVFHCAMGADRTGTLACVLEGLLGVSQSDCDKDYELTSFYGLRARNGNYQGGTTDWKHLIAQINELSGSTFRDKIVNFVLSLGIGIDEINTFRQKMIDGTPEILHAPVFNITNTLTNCTTSNLETTIEESKSYSATILPDTGYSLENATVSVTMGGVDITATAYNNGVISIPYVLGAISITVAAVLIPTYLNAIPLSIDTDGEIYNSIGYKTGVRLNSSNAEVAYTDGVLTGYMPFVLSDTISFDKFLGSESSNGGIWFYDSSFTLLAACKVNNLISENILVSGQPLNWTPSDTVFDGPTGVYKTITAAAYIRIVAKSTTPTALTCNIIPAYQQVTYIASTNGFINTGYVNTENTGLEVKVLLTEVHDSVGAGFIGNDDFYIGAATSADMRAFKGGVKSYQLASPVTINTEYNISLNKEGTGKVIINGTEKSWNSGTPTFNKGSSIYLMSCNNDQNSYNHPMRGYLYSAAIYENGTKIKQFVPCYRTADDVCGVYDILNNAFYPGIGTFTHGSIINSGENVLKVSSGSLNKYLTSSAGLGSINGYFVTDFFRVDLVANPGLRITNILNHINNLGTSNYGSCKISLCDANKDQLCQWYIAKKDGNTSCFFTIDGNDLVCSDILNTASSTPQAGTIPAAIDVKYMRLSLAINNAAAALSTVDEVLNSGIKIYVGDGYTIPKTPSTVRIIPIECVDGVKLNKDNGTVEGTGISNYAGSDFIPVSAGYGYTFSSYSLTDVTDGAISCIWYDSNKNFLLYDGVQLAYAKLATKVAPSNAAYVRIRGWYGTTAEKNLLCNGVIVLIEKDLTAINLADPTAADWQPGYRMDSSGQPVALANNILTNFIPCSAGDVIRVRNLSNLRSDSAGAGVIAGFKSDKTTKEFVIAYTGTSVAVSSINYNSTTKTGTIEIASGVTTMAYIRFGAALASSRMEKDIIITVNQEID